MDFWKNSGDKELIVKVAKKLEIQKVWLPFDKKVRTKGIECNYLDVSSGIVKDSPCSEKMSTICGLTKNYKREMEQSSTSSTGHLH